VCVCVCVCVCGAEVVFIVKGAKIVSIMKVKRAEVVWEPKLSP
jgi:hypothetical protein